MILAVYGSLKKGEMNHTTFGFDKSKFVREIDVAGYEMFSIGPFPVIVRTSDKKKKIRVELYDVPDDIYYGIYIMEVGAGYREVDEHIGGFRSKIFIYDRKPVNATLVLDGNWKGDTYEADDMEELTDKDFQELLQAYPDIEEAIRNDTIQDMDDLDEWVKTASDEEYDDFSQWVTRVEDEDENWIDGNEEDEWITALDRDMQKEEEIKNTSNEPIIISKWGDKGYDSSRPKYPLDPNMACACEQQGVKPKWEWDAHIGAWQCAKCGMTQ